MGLGASVSAAGGGGSSTPTARTEWLSGLMSAGAGATSYGAPGSTAQGAPKSVVVLQAGTLSKLTLKNANASPVAGSFTITITKNGVDTTVVAAVPGGSAADFTIQDLVHSVHFAVGDTLGIKAVNTGGTISASTFVAWLFTPDA